MLFVIATKLDVFLQLTPEMQTHLPQPLNRISIGIRMPGRFEDWAVRTRDEGMQITEMQMHQLLLMPATHDAPVCMCVCVDVQLTRCSCCTWKSWKGKSLVFIFQKHEKVKPLFDSRTSRRRSPQVDPVWASNIIGQATVYLFHVNIQKQTFLLNISINYIYILLKDTGINPILTPLIQCWHFWPALPLTSFDRICIKCRLTRNLNILCKVLPSASDDIFMSCCSSAMSCGACPSSITTSAKSPWISLSPPVAPTECQRDLVAFHLLRWGLCHLPPHYPVLYTLC